MARLNIIDTVEGVEALRAKLADATFVALDTETTGLDDGAEVIGLSICADAEEAYYIILRAWNSQEAKLEFSAFVVASCRVLVESLVGKSLIMHNSVFDCRMVQSNFGVDLMPSVHTDTMILAHLLDENRRVGLKELAASMYGETSTAEAVLMKESVIRNGGAWTAANKEMYKADARLMAEYGAKDALLTYKLFVDLVPQLFDQGLDKFFYEDESMPLLRGPTYQLNTTGCKVDLEALTTLKKTLEAECAEAKSFIYSEIAQAIAQDYPGTTKKNTFNIGAPAQLSWLLYGKLELEFDRLTEAGREVCRAVGLKLPYTRVAKRDFIARCKHHVGATYQPEVKGNKPAKAKKIRAPWGYIAVDKRALGKLAPKLKWVERLLEYQRKMKLLSTYVKGIEERTKYGIIRPSFLQHGTTSGRYASRDPNFQNLPRDDKRIKHCVRARPGRLFVGADYSQLEPRVFAYFSGDERLVRAFSGDTDFYSTIGMEVYDKTDCTPHKEGSPDAFGVKYKKLRDFSKVIALASTYGATAHQLAPTTGKSIEDTQRDIDSYFERFPGVRQMMLDSHAMAKKDGQVANLFGRPRRMPDAKRIPRLYGNLPHGELPYDARNLLNLSVNHRIQSTAASIVNRAAILFLNLCDEAEIKARIVLQVHDSLVAECEEADAESVSMILQHAMETAVELPGVALEAKPKIGQTLADV